MDLLDQIAARIRDLRIAYNHGEGLSQDSLATHLKVAPNTISRWETGTYRPSVKDLERISRFFGVSIKPRQVDFELFHHTRCGRRRKSQSALTHGQAITSCRC